ncbi:MAG: glyoxalase [Chloroflexi bacterium]|nr:MAG: glyoxalase [Chloroflexota bacterium]
MSSTSAHPLNTTIDPATEVGPLALTVSDLERSLAFYTQAIGLQVLARNATTATLGAGGLPLLYLSEAAGAQPWPRGGRSYTGLYHFAILLPSRADLGRWLRHWIELGLGLPGQGDHNVSEALYLDDPDGHGIEIYRDRPRSEWRWVNGKVQMGTGPVDVRGVIAEADREGLPFNGLPAGAKIGHMHLQVGDIPTAAHFYHDILGFDIVAEMPSALFVSAGGYHHHIGMNIWHSRGQGPAPDGFVRLQHFTIALPSKAARDEVLARLDAAGVPHSAVEGRVVVHDPWQNEIHLRVGSTG